MQEIGNLLKHYFLHIVCHKGTINVLWMWTRKTNFGEIFGQLILNLFEMAELHYLTACRLFLDCSWVDGCYTL